MLEISGLRVFVSGKEIVKGVDFSVGRGEIHVILGPNGSGKTSFLLGIIGYPGYEVHGKILFKGEEIQNLPIHERVKKGIGIAFQNPPAVKGVKLKDIVDLDDNLVKSLGVEHLLERDVNVGFSGGERKRAELLQVLSMRPGLLLLDEPESGVDIENVERMAGVLKEYLKGRSAIIVTHTGYIIEYLDVQKAHVFLDGKIVCSGDPEKIFKTVREKGFARCVSCGERKT